ncbi:MAG: hypothetical protein ACI9IL_000618 [Rickettsiales bacterium]|jgi:hypothetical protein
MTIAEKMLEWPSTRLRDNWRIQNSIPFFEEEVRKLVKNHPKYLNKFLKIKPMAIECLAGLCWRKSSLFSSKGAQIRPRFV